MTVATPQFDLVRDTLPLVFGRLDQATLAFDAHLLRIAPSWGAGRAAGGGNGAALLQVISAGLAGHLASEGVVQRLQTLAQDMAARGLRPQGYIAIHAALMEVVCEQIAARRARDAWEEVIGTILSSMLAEAYGPRRTATPLAA